MPEDIHQRTGTPALSRNGQLYAFLGKLVGKEEFAIEVFEIKSGKRIARIDNVRSYLPENGAMMTRSNFYGMKFSPDNSKIYVGAWDRISVYSIATKSYESSFNLHRDISDSERITPKLSKKEGTLMDIALAENAGGVDIREATGGLQVNAFAVSPQGLLATGTYGGAMSLWNMTQGRYLHSFESLPEETVEHVEFAPNGEWLSFYVGGELHLVDVKSVSAAAGEK
jgi:WD40 repeat protein